MTAKKTEKPILIVSNSADELRAVQELMTSELGGYRSADNKMTGLRLFEEYHPAVLVLAFDDIEAAQRYYLTLYRQCKGIQDIPHQTLLLCKAAEAESAYGLCQSGTIDDYIVSRPLYDPFRLRLSIRQAQARRQQHQQSATQNRQMANVSGDLTHLDHFIGKNLALGQAQQEASLRAFQGFTAKLNHQIEKFEENLCNPALGNVVQVLDQGGLRRQFDQLRKQSLVPEAQQVEGQLRSTSALLKDFGNGYRQCIEPIRQGDMPAPLPEVMVVDDDETYREILTAMIENVGLRVTTAADGETALAKLHFRRPNVILMDYQMPGMDGLATVRRIKADLDLKAVPVVMMTGDSERSIVEKSICAGAVGFIVKPGDITSILAKINSALDNPG